MGLFWLGSKQDKDFPAEIPGDLPAAASSSPKAFVKSPQNSSVAPTLSIAADHSSQEEEYYEGQVVPLTIKSTPGLESLADSSEGTEITMSPPRQLDKFGFIINIDANGEVYDSTLTPAAHSERVPTFAEAKRISRREKKWDTTIATWHRQRPQKLKERLRKGIPDNARGKVWVLLGGGIRRKGLYQEIVKKTTDAMLGNCKEIANSQSMASTNSGSHHSKTSPTSSSSHSSSRESTKYSPRTSADPTDYAYTKTFRAVQDTIERDIHRTFPRHDLFYERDDDKADDEALVNAASSLLGLGVCDPELAGLILNLESDMRFTNNGSAGVLSSSDILASTVPDGQAALRRVLRAYSYYDREIGYCQGMNFIAGMFLTLMSEEEAFWLLVAVMHEKPCEMRGMFGEGMRETHKVLHVAERLIHQHLPRLARHFDDEHIHVTMYATQWLLTQYTSSFKFDLVTRVWDCFLGEGWKAVYRVMLALLQQWQTQLLKMSFEEILSFFRELPERVEGHAIIETALRIPLKTRHIVKYEKEWYTKQQQLGHISR